MGHPALDLTNKTAVAIGGTSGIGPTLAKGLARAGANVVPTGRRADLVRAAAEEICKQHRRTMALTCDVTDRSTLESLRDTVCAELVTIASLSSFVGLFEVAAYAASKSAVASLTKSLAVEWARQGGCVNAIVPGVFRTDLTAPLLDITPRGQEFLLRTPMRRFGELEELVGAAVFLASDAASFVTGHLLVVDGGFLASGVNQ